MFILLNKQKMAEVDDADGWLVEPYLWYVAPKRDGGVYVARSGPKENRWRPIYLHRWLLNAGEGQFVDHIDGDGLNNTRSNLRICTPLQNSHNSRRKRTASSKFKGLWFDVRTGNWQTNIQVEGKHLYMGQFKSEEDAARAYDAAARKYFGEFARTNFPDENARSAWFD